MIRLVSADVANSMLISHYLGPVRRARITVACSDGEAIGVYGWPTTGNFRFGFSTIELMRLWSPDQYSGVLSQFVAQTIKIIHKECPEVDLLVSYADSEAGHHGGIYRASNWLYAGRASAGGPQGFIIDKEPNQGIHQIGFPGLVEDSQTSIVHTRTVSHRYGHCNREQLEKELGVKVTAIARVPKHTFYYPLTKKVRRVLNQKIGETR